MPSATISKQIVLSHITDITLSLTVDPSRFSRMVSGKGKPLGSFEQRVAGIKNLCTEDWFLTLEPQFSKDVLAFVEYVSAGQPVWVLLP
jgi:hypothetical protein